MLTNVAQLSTIEMVEQRPVKCKISKSFTFWILYFLHLAQSFIGKVWHSCGFVFILFGGYKSDKNKCDITEAFSSSSRYVDVLLKGSVFFKNRHFIIEERLDKVIYDVNTITKCGI